VGAADPILRARGLSKSYGAVPVLQSVDLDVPRGAIVALLGASGSGKTTLLQVIAGLARPDAGTLTLDGVDMAGVPAFERPVNMMFQSYALFPHLTVAGNVGYGLAARGVPRAERARRIGEALELVRLSGLGDRRPDQLSGGQRQRVALARCLVLQPAVLLLDEPMAALDRGLRADVQRELVAIQRSVGTTFILVTHDQEEAMTIADYVAVMDRGRVVQFGPPREVYDRPRTRFVASFLGRVNLFDAESEAGGVRSADGLTLVLDAGVPPAVGPLAVAVRPEKAIVARGPTGERNDFPGTVAALSYAGSFTQVKVRLAAGRELEATLINDAGGVAAGLAVGDPVHIGFAPASAVVLAP
jgi:putrescine transport system ATP-binding protein